MSLRDEILVSFRSTFSWTAYGAEGGHDSNLCDSEAGLDQEAAEEAKGAGARVGARVFESRESLRLGKALPAANCGERGGAERPDQTRRVGLECSFRSD